MGARCHTGGLEAAALVDSKPPEPLKEDGVGPVVRVGSVVIDVSAEIIHFPPEVFDPLVFAKMLTGGDKEAIVAGGCYNREPGFEPWITPKFYEMQLEDPFCLNENALILIN